MKKKRYIKITLMILIVLFTTGCWNKVELDEKAIVAGVGIDKTKDGKIQITVQTILHREMKVQSPGGKRGKQKPTEIVTTTGDSLFDAIRNLPLQMGRKASWTHTKIVVIGKTFAQKGIDQIIDFLEREPEIRRRIWLLVANGDAKKVMESEVVDFEVIQSYGISDIIQTYNVTSKTAPIDLHNYLGMISNENKSAFISGIKTLNSELSGETKQNKLVLTDTGVFKNNKLVGWFDAKEVRGLLWILSKVKSGIIHIKYSEDKFITQEIIRANSEIIPEIQDDNLKIIIEMSEEGNIGEMTEKMDLSDQKVIAEIEKNISRIIKTEIKNTIAKAQELNTDIFGFSGAFHRKYPKKWSALKEDWDNIFPHLKVEIKVNAKIRRTGLISGD